MDVTSLESVCAALTDDVEKARSLLRTSPPHVPVARSPRAKLPLRTQVEIFTRDGYIDRYSGQRLVFPGVLRLLSRLMHDEFPYHPHWKTDRCHAAYWHLYPTIDHKLPIARGGLDERDNMFTTSMLRNSAKQLWTLEELGWTLLPEGHPNAWDGLTGWFLRYTDNHSFPEFERWQAALRSLRANSS